MNDDFSDKIKVPDIILEIKRNWKDKSLQAQQNLARDFQKLKDKLVIEARKIKNIYNEEDATDLVFDYLCGRTAKDGEAKSGLIQMSEDIIKAKRSFSILVNDLHRLASAHNPEGRELNLLLNEAIRTLEKEGKVIRDASSVGKYLSARTQVKLLDAPNREATIDDYQANAGSVGTYTTRPRRGTVENSRIITPNDARELIIKLLKAFNGWTKVDDIWSVAYNHTPKQMHIETITDLSKRQESNDQHEDAIFLDKIQSVQNHAIQDQDIQAELMVTILDFYGEQAVITVRDKPNQIWDMVCKAVGDEKLFCLYFIPNRLKDNQTEETPHMALKDFGIPQTIKSRTAKLDVLWEQELNGLLNFRGNNPHADIQIDINKQIIIQIIQQLIGRCTEKGYNPHLDIVEDN